MRRLQTAREHLSTHSPTYSHSIHVSSAQSLGFGLYLSKVQTTIVSIAIHKTSRWLFLREPNGCSRRVMLETCKWTVWHGGLYPVSLASMQLSHHGD